MGLVLCNNKDSVKIGYIGFGHLRQNVAYAISERVGFIYNKMYNGIEITDKEFNYLDKNVPKYLIKFLFHSDCDGHFCKRDANGIYRELIKLKVIFKNEDLENKYYKMLELFSQGERIDLY